MFWKKFRWKFPQSYQKSVFSLDLSLSKAVKFPHTRKFITLFSFMQIQDIEFIFFILSLVFLTY